MRISYVTSYTLSCVAAAMLTGCGGSQPLIGAPGAMALAKQHFLSGVHPELYVANRGNNTITVYRGRGEKLVQTSRTESTSETSHICCSTKREIFTARTTRETLSQFTPRDLKSRTDDFKWRRRPSRLGSRR